MDESNDQVTTETESQTQPPVEQTAPVETPAPEQATEATNVTDVPDAPVAEATETPQASAPETQEEDEPDFSKVQTAQPQAVDIQQYIDDQGNLDLAGYQAAQAATTQAIVQAAVEQARTERAYEKTWEKAYEAHPELRNNKELRDMVQAIHANSPQSGKYLSPKAAADKLFGLRGQAKQEGIKAAQETRTIQAAATLGNSAPAANPTQAGTKIASLRQAREAAPTLKAREDANNELLAELIRSGAL